LREPKSHGFSSQKIEKAQRDNRSPRWEDRFFQSEGEDPGEAVAFRGRRRP
jgi:hypothetical protein